MICICMYVSCHCEDEAPSILAMEATVSLSLYKASSRNKTIFQGTGRKQTSCLACHAHRYGRRSPGLYQKLYRSFDAQKISWLPRLRAGMGGSTDPCGSHRWVWRRGVDKCRHLTEKHKPTSWDQPRPVAEHMQPPLAGFQMPWQPMGPRTRIRSSPARPPALNDLEVDLGV